MHHLWQQSSFVYIGEKIVEDFNLLCVIAIAFWIVSIGRAEVAEDSLYNDIGKLL